MKVFIDGAAGTTGLRIRERLVARSEITLLEIDPARRKDAAARAEALNAADAVVLCLPDAAAREAVALVANPATRIIDASTAHRTADGWSYGFPELVGRDTIATAARISNPGCYSTGFIALVAPLVKAGLIPAATPLTCNAVSGYSGGGNAMIAEYEGGGSAPTAYRTYALGLDHKHVPEMRHWCGLTVAPIFAPAVVPLHSGMVVDIPLHAAALPGGPSSAQMRQALADFYAGSRIIRVVAPDGAALEIERLAGTDRLDLMVLSNDATGQIRLVALLDNLGKGASGAAVQSLNLVGGFDETAGLVL
jgi:N-acetyl-gamma-glutamyl-phosphate reductase